MSVSYFLFSQPMFMEFYSALHPISKFVNQPLTATNSKGYKLCFMINYCNFDIKITTMKNFIFTCLILTLGFTSAYAQGNPQPSLVLCDNYDENGVASGIYASWNIDISGGYVYILYNQTNTINAQTMYLQVDKKSIATDAYTAEKTITLTPEPGKNWLMYDYYFSEEAMYRLSIIMDGNTMATTETSVSVVDADLIASDTISTFYYENSVVSFCEKVIDGQMIGESETFKLGEDGKVDVTIFISSDVPFKTELFYVDVYEGDDLYESYDMEVLTNWDYAHVIQTFTRPGSYEVEIYNADDIYVNTGFVTIE